jgi:NADH-quinone oxidoreductase subunit F
MLARLRSGRLAEARDQGEQKLAACLDVLCRRTTKRPVVYVGAGTCGLGAGAGKTLAAVREHLDAGGIDAEVVEVGCIGLCSREPIVDIQLPGRRRVSFGAVTAEKAGELLDAVVRRGEIPADLVLGQFRDAAGDAWEGVPWLDEHPFFARQKRVVLANCGVIDPGDIDQYLAMGGYSAMAGVLDGMTREAVCELVTASGLRGRGGGGFPTGRKWRFALDAPAGQKYLICNADEGDPGAFMDRAVCESDPHRLIEGIAIAAYAIGATKAYIYIRAEYPLAIRNLTRAIEQARRYGLVGDNILDSGNDLSITIKQGAGAFVCGEETALIHSIEGKRGMPRPRPPFPAVSGLFGRPTVINNVETLSSLAMIVERGAEWFASMGTQGSKGTKVFALSGMVARTGLAEVPMGTTLRQVVFDIGGGIPNGKRCKAVQIGGPSGGCVPEAHLDIPTDYEALKSFGTIMGSGGLVVLDESTCMVDFAKFFMEFIQSESCGKCIPCREGTRQMLEILQALTRSRRHEQDTDALVRFSGMMRLESLAETIKATSLCGLGQTAPNPVLSTLKWFRDEYEAHLYDRQCPAGACKELAGVACQNACPVGTETWRYVANVAAGDYTEAYKVIRRANPLPSVCARVCHHPCERNCRAGTTGGQPIALRTLKRFVVDNVHPDVFHVEPVPADRGAVRIAVIGGGPAGLTAAHYLSLQGHKVTILERERRLGGMLAGAIPEYRMPRAVLDREIQALLNDNIEVKCDSALGRDFTVDELLADGHKAVYVAIGAHRSRDLGLDGEDAAGIVPGLEFLKAHNLHGKGLARGRVGIVGGGNSAMDAARVAVRQDGVESVTVYYRRTRAEMPAYAEEIEAGLAEGVRIVELVAPVSLRTDGRKLAAVRFIRNRLGQPDASGRRSPVPVEGSEFEAELDTLVVAISEAPDSSDLARLPLGRWGTLAVNAESHASQLEGVFGGGDVVGGPGTVIEAIAAGKRAALMIDRYVRGKLLKLLPSVSLPSVYIAPAGIVDDDAQAVERVSPPELPVDGRNRGFAEVELCIAEREAVREAGRCLRCDLDFTQPV